MNRHITFVHEGKRPFECNICTKGFTSNKDLKRHHKFVHEGGKQDKPFKCDICTSGFKQPCDVKRHIREVHEGKKPERKRKIKKDVKCDICEGTFQCHSHLNRHILTVHACSMRGEGTVNSQNVNSQNEPDFRTCLAEIVTVNALAISATSGCTYPPRPGSAPGCPAG